MDETSNLPDWPGAAHCYSRAYALLATWGANGFRSCAGRKRYCITPPEMDHPSVAALNRGDEETIKAVFTAEIK